MITQIRWRICMGEAAFECLLAIIQGDEYGSRAWAIIAAHYARLIERFNSTVVP